MNTKDGVYIIAEAGVNHNGDLDRALAMIDIAADCGADAIKFQTFIPELLVSHHAPKANYQIANTGDQESQLAMLKRLALSFSDHNLLLDRCQQKNIDFLSSPFDTESASFLIRTLKISRIKIGSGELTNAPLLLHIAQQGVSVILSTGMSTLDEVKTALGVLAFGYLNFSNIPSEEEFNRCLESPEAWTVLKIRVTLLHCTTEYPCPYDEVNLRAMDSLRDAFGLAVGYSDHTSGIAVSIAATAKGATVIEKHFTLDRALPGPDHKASLEPTELKELTKCVHQVYLAMGNSIKGPSSHELANLAIARKSLVAKKPIKKGDIFTEENITVKRPGSGLPPIKYWKLIGNFAHRDYAEDDQIQL
ncbi:MAG: N-acetylneuraminate synthase [Gammaproteobacteria bacterium]|nr:N-acetylneuraminate synthase [Gammaproteobacteria bacterium]